MPYPVTERQVCRSVACAASTKQTSEPSIEGNVGKSEMSSVVGCGESGRSFWGCVCQQYMLYVRVALRYLATFLMA